MDDLIDSIARRHLAYRRLDVCIKNFQLFSIKNNSFFQAAIDRQGRGNKHYSPYNGTTSLRNDNSLYTNRSSRNYIDHGLFLIDI